MIVHLQATYRMQLAEVPEETRKFADHFFG
jgi:hypothetical protein